MQFEDQAARYDERAWLPVDAVEGAALALARMAGLGDGAHILEIAAGTGAIGLGLLRLPIHYTGFDRSPAMLEIFRQKMKEQELDGTLLQSDGNERWPAEDHTVDLAFSSRALHLLDADHVVSETLRVLRPGGVLAIAKVWMPPELAKPTLQRRMRQILEEHGYRGKSGGAGGGRIFRALEAAGAHALEPVVVARWRKPYAPIDSFDAWESKQGLDGLELPRDVQRRVLDQLRAWAESEYGDLREPRLREEYLEIRGVRVEG